MAWVDIVITLAVLQLFWFALLVGKARGTYGVKAPATSGNEIFERHYRVQMNTIETLVIFLPSIWIAAHYWNPVYMAALGVVYLIGREMYRIGYVREPARRSAGYGLSLLPTIILAFAGLIGAVLAVLH